MSPVPVLVNAALDFTLARRTVAVNLLAITTLILTESYCHPASSETCSVERGEKKSFLFNHPDFQVVSL